MNYQLKSPVQKQLQFFTSYVHLFLNRLLVSKREDTWYVKIPFQTSPKVVFWEMLPKME